MGHVPSQEELTLQACPCPALCGTDRMDRVLLPCSEKATGVTGTASSRVYLGSGILPAVGNGPLCSISTWSAFDGIYCLSPGQPECREEGRGTKQCLRHEETGDHSTQPMRTGGGTPVPRGKHCLCWLMQECPGSGTDTSSQECVRSGVRHLLSLSLLFQTGGTFSHWDPEPSGGRPTPSPADQH